MALRNQFIEHDPASSRIQDLTAGFIKKLKAQSTIQPADKASWHVDDYEKAVGEKRRAEGYLLSGGPTLIYRLNASQPDQALLRDALSILNGLDVQAIRHNDSILVKHEALMVCVSWSQDQRATQNVIEAYSSTQQLEGAVCLSGVQHGI